MEMCFLARYPELVDGLVPLVAVAGSATVRRRACAGYLGGYRPPLQTEMILRLAFSPEPAEGSG